MSRKKRRPKKNARTRPPQRRLSPLAVAFGGWCVFILAKAFSGFWPVFKQGLLFFTFPQLRGAGREASLAALAGGYALDLLMLGAVAAAAEGFGGLAVRAMLHSRLAGLERFLMAQGLGLGMLALFTLLLGSLGWASPGLAYFLIGAGLGLTAVRATTGKPQPAGGSPEEPGSWADLGLLERVLMGILIYSGLLHLIGALGPETFYDSLVYHLAAPSQYLLRGSITRLDGIMHANFPQNMEMLYLLSLGVRGEILAKLTHLWTLALSVAAIYGFGRMIASRRTALTACALFSAVPVVSAAAWHTGVELGVTFWSFMGMWTLLRGFRCVNEPGGGAELPRWLAASGILFGLAMGAKYTALWSAGAAGACLLVWLWRSTIPTTQKFRAAAVWAAAAAVVLVPWLAKNLLLTGNPVYPFLAGIFPSRNPVDLAAFTESARGHFWFGGIAHWKTWLLTPWLLLTKGRSSFSFIGPLFLIYLPLISLVRRASFPFGWLLLAFGINYLAWNVSTSMVRLLIPALPWFCLYVAHLLTRLGRDTPAWAPWTAVALAVYYVSWNAAMLNEKDLPGVVLGCESRSGYLAHKHHGYHNPYHDLAVGATAALPRNARLLVVGDSRTFFLPRPAEAHSVFDRSLLLEAIRSSSEAREVYAALRAKGISHLFVNHGEVYRLLRPRLHLLPLEKLRLLSRFFRGYQKLLSRNKRGAALFEMREPKGPVPAARSQAELPEIVRLAVDGHPAFADKTAPEQARLLIYLAD